jgi:hypothetical protein
MTSATCLSQYLSNASAVDIADWLMAMEAPDLGHVTMRQLLAQDPAKANRVLCHVYDVACYQVGDSCFADRAPADEKGKWFVSVVAGTFTSADTETIPLADSLAAAEALAVKHLQLEKLFFEVNRELVLEEA